VDPLLLDRVAAIDHERLTGDVACLRTPQG
jgi:hypothetical protein